MSRLITTVLIALALLWATSCSAYRVIEHETLVRFVPQEDVLLMLEVEHGIQSESPGTAGVGLAVEALRSADNGHRQYPAAGGLLSLDFDDLESMDALADDRSADFREFAAAVHVEERGLFLGDRGRLSFFRLTRFEHCSRLLELVNARVRREESGPEKESRPFTSEFPFFDIESWKLVRAALGSEHRWLAVENDSIVLDVPMTSANAARCLGFLVAEKHGAAEAQARQFFEQITSLEVADGHARLHLFGEERRVMRFFGTSADEDYDDAVNQRLVELGVALGGPDAPARARAKFDAAGKPRER